MPGRLLLASGAEFGGGMAAIDQAALALIGLDAPVRIIPTAAAADNNHERAGRNGVRWFERLGAQDVVSLPIVDRASAESVALADRVRAARLIYMLGGFPGFLADTLANSACWNALVEANANGAIIAGSSAGAMVMCSTIYDPQRGAARAGLGLLPKTCVLPHHNSFGQRWATHLLASLPDTTLIGIDEATGALGEGDQTSGWRWTCYGPGVVTIYRNGGQETYANGQRWTLPV